MGEIADSMINGEFDFHTGEYLGRPVGYPRTRNGSLSWEKGSNRKRGARFKFSSFSDYNKMRGVQLYLHDKGFIKSEKQNELITEYAETVLKLTLPSKKRIMYASVEIQKNFTQFTSWLKQKNTINH